VNNRSRPFVLPEFLRHLWEVSVRFSPCVLRCGRDASAGSLGIESGATVPRQVHARRTCVAILNQTLTTEPLIDCDACVF